MKVDRNHRADRGPGNLVWMLYALPIVCLLISIYMIFGAQVKPIPIVDATAGKENGSLMGSGASRDTHVRPVSIDDPLQLQAATPSPTMGEVSGFAAKSPTSASSSGSSGPSTALSATNSNEVVALSPIAALANHPYYASASEYFALRQAIAHEDYVSAFIAVQELAQVNATAKEVLEHLIALWPHRNALICDYCAMTHAPLTMIDTLAGKPGKVVGASKDGITLEIGLSSHLMPWEGIPPKEQGLLWYTMAQNEQATESVRLIALFRHVLDQDYVTSRLLLRRLQHSASVDPSGLKNLVTSIERWDILRLAMVAHIARQNQDRVSEDSSIVGLTQLVGLAGNEWAIDILKELRRKPFAGESKPASPDAALITIEQLNRPFTLMGNWSPDKHGARCIGGGDIQISNLGNATGVELLFTPIAYQGALRLMFRNTTINIDFNRGMLEVKAPPNAAISIPVAIYPRYQNDLIIQFGDLQDPMRMIINHDRTLPTFPALQKMADMTMSLSAGSDIRVHQIVVK